jgi:HEAT repeat protein
MLREDRVKTLLAPTFGSLQKVLSLLRALPWHALPVPDRLQRIGKRGLERLKARIPELAELLDGKPRTAPTSQKSAPSTSLVELLELIGARDYETRAKAAQGLANHRDDEAVDALILALRDRSVEVAVAAATSLSMSGSARARRALLAVLENAEGFYHALTRAASVHGLGGVQLREDPMPLQRALRDVEAEVSIAAISALSSTWDRQSAAALLGVVENADGFYLPITRLAAARGLERLPLSPVADLERVRAWEADASVIEVLERLLERARAGASIES